MVVLNWTVERVDPNWDEINDGYDTNWGFAVIKVGSIEVGRTPLTYNEYDDGDEGLERAAAGWLKARLAGSK